MGRLTERCGNTYVPNENVNYEPMNCMDKLGRLEDLEEQGRLIELPCAVGDTVYAIQYGESKPFIVIETTIVEIRQNLHGWYFIPNETMRGFKLGDFGRNVFLTKEEAEAKLKMAT